MKIGLSLLSIAAVLLTVNLYNNWQQAIGEAKEAGKQAVRDRDALYDALKETKRLNEVVKKANDETTKYRALHTALTRDNRVLLGGMRDLQRDIDSRVSSASAAALANAIRAYGGLLEACQSRYTEVAGAASGHLIDVKGLTASWPRSEP